MNEYEKREKREKTLQKMPGRVMLTSGGNAEYEYIKEEQSVDICGRSSSRDGDVPLWGGMHPLYLLKGGRG